MQVVAQGWLVLKLTDSPLFLGLVTFANSLPMLLFMLPSGVIADRFSKRKILILTHALEMICALLLAGLVIFGVIDTWHVFVFAVFLGFVYALELPAIMSFPIELVGEEDLLNAVALDSAAFNGARVVGPAIAGIIVAAYGTGMVFLVNGITYTAAIVTLMMIRCPPSAAEGRREPMLAQITEGLRYVRSNTLVRDLLIMSGVTSLFVIQYAVIMPAFARDVLDVGAEGLGVLMSSAGIGALAGALSIAVLGHSFRQGIIVMTGAMLAPVGLVSFAASSNFYLSMVCLVFVGLGGTLFFTASRSMLQVVPPEELRGRVMSVQSLAFVGVAPAGALVVGVLAEYVGVRESLLIGGIIGLCAGLYFVLRSHTVRSAE